MRYLCSYNSGLLSIRLLFEGTEQMARNAFWSMLKQIDPCPMPEKVKVKRTQKTFLPDED